MGEQKGETAFSFKCRTKLLFAGNTFPEIAEVESGQAFIERLCFLLFPVSIPKEKQDQQLLEHLLSERDAIFSLAIRTLPELIQQNMLFVTCPESINFLENISEQQSHVKRFIDECCQRRPGCRISTLSLYTEYQEFCKQNCFKAYAVTQFSEIVRNIAQVDSCRFRDGGNPVRGFSGLTLQEPYLTRHGTIG